MPAPGTTMGVGDRIDISIEAEFTGPPKRVALRISPHACYASAPAQADE